MATGEHATPAVIAGCLNKAVREVLLELFRTMEEIRKQGDIPPAGGAGDVARHENKMSPLWKRPSTIIVGAIALTPLFFLGVHYIAESFTHESTDDAFLAADIVSIAPRIAGEIKRVYVADNQLVKAGDPLVEIDPRDFEVQLAQKKAAQVAAESNVKLIESSIALLGAQVNTAEATAKQSEAEAAADQATADRASADLKRAEELIRNTTISPQEFDAAKAVAAAANATLKAGRAKSASDLAKVAESQAQLDAGRRAWDRAQAQAKQSGVDVDQARLNLSYTHVTAPQNGRVTRKSVEAGDYVQVGQRLMALVPAEVWVTANFKENQLKNIRTNQPVTIKVDSISGRTFAGRVQSIQAGSGAAFSLLPPENAVGNFVKVVQRVPVKIVFDPPVEAEHILGPGMSVEPAVRVTNYEIPDFVVAIIAVILALVAGLFWRRAANKTPPAA
jgi:membrane fusion protein (multidrug efflux system)